MEILVIVGVISVAVTVSAFVIGTTRGEIKDSREILDKMNTKQTVNREKTDEIKANKFVKMMVDAGLLYD